MLARLARRVARRIRPRLVSHSLTDDAFVRAVQDATVRKFAVAVYDDKAAPHADAATLDRELDASIPSECEVSLPAVPTQQFGRTSRTIRARCLADADPPVVLLSRRSLADWDERTRNFAIAHEVGHLLADPPDPESVATSLRPMPDRSALAVRALLDAHAEYRAGQAHADLRASFPERHRTPPDVMAAYHAAERGGENGAVLSDAERHALAVRDAAKYLPLPYDPLGIAPEVRTALARPLSRYVEWVINQPGKPDKRA